jgi:hypothetical protein
MICGMALRSAISFVSIFFPNDCLLASCAIIVHKVKPLNEGDQHLGPYGPEETIE